MKCQGKTNRANSTKCTSRLLTAFNSSNTNRRLRSRKVILRKSRKPAVLPCSLNECHDVEVDDDNGSNGSNGGNASNGGNGANGTNGSSEGNEGNNSSEQDCVNDAEGTVKTVETTLEGGKPDELSGNDENKNGNGNKEKNDADKEAQGDDETDSQSATDGGSQEEEDGSGSESDDGSTKKDGKDMTAAEAEEAERRKKKKRRKIEPRPMAKHIHPCICDLSTKAQARIKAHIRKREEFEMRHTKRLESIDAELRAIEEEIARKQQEEQEQVELFGDKYEVVGKKKKRMKRSARRASMVSLGVKQVINWKKSPKIKVHQNQVSNLRKNFTSYCGDRPVGLPEIKKIASMQSPKIAVRITKTASLRSEFNIKKRQYIIDNESKKPDFDLSHYY